MWLALKESPRKGSSISSPSTKSTYCWGLILDSIPQLLCVILDSGSYRFRNPFHQVLILALLLICSHFVADLSLPIFFNKFNITLYWYSRKKNEPISLSIYLHVLSMLVWQKTVFCCTVHNNPGTLIECCVWSNANLQIQIWSIQN